MEITLQLFGAFRSFGESLKLTLPANAVISGIREVLTKKLIEVEASPNKIMLIDISRFATETEILSEETSLQDGMVITIIPPVSGG